MVKGPTQFARELGDLLERQLADAISLSQVLEDELEALTKADADGIARITDHKNQLMLALDQLGREQTDLLASIRASADTSSRSAILAWCSPDGALAAQWDEVTERLSECNQKNQRNGLLVQKRLTHVRRALNILDNAQPEAGEYGPDGATERGASSRFLAQG